MAQSAPDKRSLPLLIIGALLIADSLFAAGISNFNLGVIMPAILGTPLVIYGAFRHRRFFASRFGRAIKYVALAAYIIYALLVAALVFYSAGVFTAEPQRNADAVIVLGAGVQGDEPSLTLVRRVARATEYAKDNPDALIVVSGGKGNQENLSEAEVMHRLLIEAGIAPERIIDEARATSTQENFTFSKPLLDARFPDGCKIVYVTNEFHAFRSAKTAETAGFTGAQCLPIASVWYLAPNYYMREVFAIAEYFAAGKM